ncbi:hypothetical protein K466DRAFT_484852 [Polyporus arcularius HHB13444]|uniref:Uncharacterized protein n=1 Tax=Polyporus arcularius HHB13444 TaxID=1314778 RepID=A0A5C3PRC5_9APHY|nr:hypothetical protein K466DRAFT_484852 [Polyporus arcularius HHB13444]
MPARTLPTTSPDPALSPPRFYTRVAPHTPPLSRPHRDSYDDRSLEPPFYAVAMPPPNARPDPDYAAQQSWLPPPSQRVYPDPSSIPPHWQIHPATIQQLRDGRTYVPPPPVLQNSRLPWQHPYSRALQVQPINAPPPPPLPHKVWILDCKGCGTFLTNRGMKAVLLLRPNVPLYSTDALPINCSAFTSEAEAPTQAASSSVSTTSSTRSSISGPSGELPQPAGSTERSPSRTCECLTQTLCCHGCGNPVGYMIVSPCQRCTSSITVNNRATNGHRFVFYSSEITACERHYVRGERGVHPFHPPPPAPPMHALQTSLAGLTIGTSSSSSIPSLVPASPPSPGTPASMPPLSPGPALPGRRPSVDYLPTPPPESDSPFAPNSRIVPATSFPASATVRRSTVSVSTSMNLSTAPGRLGAGPIDDSRQLPPPAPPNWHSPSPYTGTPNLATSVSRQTSPPMPPSPSRARAASASAASAAANLPAPTLHGYILNGTPVFLQRPLHLIQPVQPPPPPVLAPEPLKAGEIVYWHHLLRSGEIPAVSEDPRARVGKPESKSENTGRRNTIPSGVVAGR